MTLFTDLKVISELDDPNSKGFLNYKTVNKSVITHVENSHYKTLEALTDSIAKLCVTKLSVKRIIVDVSKPNALRFTDNVSIEIERSEKDYQN